MISNKTFIFRRIIKFLEKDSFEIFDSNKNFREFNSPKIYFEKTRGAVPTKMQQSDSLVKISGVQRLVLEIDPREPSTFLKSATDFAFNLSGRKILTLRILGNDLEPFENHEKTYLNRFLWLL